MTAEPTQDAARSANRQALAWSIFIVVFGLIYSTDVGFLGYIAFLPINLVLTVVTGHLTAAYIGDVADGLKFSFRFSLLANLMGVEWSFRGRQVLSWMTGPLVAVPFYFYAAWVSRRKRSTSPNKLRTITVLIGLYIMCIVSALLSMFV